MKNNRPFFPGRHQASAGENLKLKAEIHQTQQKMESLYLRAECSLAPLSVSAPALQASGTAGFLKNETM